MELAINGGSKIRTTLFPNQNTIGDREIIAANRVLKDGLLTGYQANIARMHGGPEIQGLEYEWGEAFGKPGSHLHCIPVNSCTSGLMVACGAIGIKPGDEVIVTPYSMTCSATAPMVWGGIPVFADVDPLTFNLDPDDVERKITPRTKAIIVVDLFGHPYDKRIDEIAHRYNLKVVEDAAQAVGATRMGGTSFENHNHLFAGTLGHIGVFSFNLGKHLTCGEGGMICTYDDDLALRCELLINHAESIINDVDYRGMNVFGEQNNYHKLFGFNLRMTEINAAILRAQLSRKEELVWTRVDNVRKLLKLLSGVPGLYQPVILAGCEHTFYVCALRFDESVWGVHRDKVVNAVKAELMPCAGREYEGVTISGGYIKPIWRMPLFNDYVETHLHQVHQDFVKGIFSVTPICDLLWRDKLIVTHRFFGPNATEEDLRDVADAFRKVYTYREELL